MLGEVCAKKPNNTNKCELCGKKATRDCFNADQWKVCGANASTRRLLLAYPRSSLFSAMVTGFGFNLSSY